MRPLTWIRVARAALAAACLLAAPAALRAQELEDFDTTMVVQKVNFDAIACRTYQFWKTRAAPGSTFLANVGTCHGTAPPSGAALLAAADTLGVAITASASAPKETDACGPVLAVLPARPAGAPAPATDVKGGLRLVQSAAEPVLKPAATSAEAFETLARDPVRRQACGALIDDLVALFATDPAGASPKAVAREVDRKRAEARAGDLFRKAGTVAAAAVAGNALTEVAGSPDKIVMSLMTGLGAEENSDGTNLVMTANLAALFFESEADRLKKPAWVRGLFLRAVLPLEKTAADPVTGDGDAATPAPAGSRMALQLGGSLLDASDPRLPEHRDCYRAALAYIPVYGSQARAATDREERLTYVDVCHKLAAAKQRLSWRAGVSLLTEPTAAMAGGAAGSRTRVELYSAAVVWAPSSWAYTNWIYQSLRIPTRADSFGLGVSVGRNVGGSVSGIDAWARMGLDMLGFAQRLAKAGGGDDWRWQARLAVTLRGRVSDGAFTTVSIGPRILGDGSGDVDLLSTVSLSYDVDHLFTDISRPAPLVP